jgi:hypothetical protein
MADRCDCHEPDVFGHHRTCLQQLGPPDPPWPDDSQIVSVTTTAPWLPPVISNPPR